jgi:hypothetical protein
VCLFIHSPGDAFFKAAINSVKDVPQFMELDRKRQSTERFMMEYFNSFLSTLLTVPDNPDQQVLYLIRGLLNGLDEYQWSTTTDCKMRVYMNATCLLAAACQVCGAGATLFPDCCLAKWLCNRDFC